jgi:hypothetical protein
MKRLTIFLLLAVSSACLAASPLKINGLIKVDTIGYRPGDQKFAVITADPKGWVEVRKVPGGETVLKLPFSAITDMGQDETDPPLHGDHVWQVDFSVLTLDGHYQIAAPKIGGLSYDFVISHDAYNKAALLASKSFFYQRCGIAKSTPYAGLWVDDQPCHLSDKAVKPLCTKGGDYGEKDYGVLDLSGGWHDAGDFEKKIGHSSDCGVDSYGYSGESLWYLMTAYEWNPGLFKNGVTNIPESGNGVPDILNEAKWELDWYLKLQQPDGHVIAKVFTTMLWKMTSPPSSDQAPRFYGPPTREAEGVFVASLAHASRLFAAFPPTVSYAKRLKEAALKTWNLWVKQSPDSGPRLWAAGELFRLDPKIEGAREAVEKSTFLKNFQPPVNDAFKGVLAYLESGKGDSEVEAQIRTALGAQVDLVFQRNDSYRSGMDYSLYLWNSNWDKAEEALALLWGARLKACGFHSAEECRNHAEDFLHYFHGLNPLNMFYMTHADLAGGKHGVWQPSQVWFNDSRNPAKMRRFSGKPVSIIDPLWPYTQGEDNFSVSDDHESEVGPAPGYVPDGPTFQYFQLKGQAEPPNLTGGESAPVLKAYRDWNFIDNTGLKTQPWIVNECGIYDTASYLLLCAAFGEPL